MTRKNAERQQYIEKLREILKPGDVVYTTIKHVSRSGMSRSINVTVIKDNKPRWLSYWVAKAIDYPFDEKREAVKVGGCGMDMGFALVYDLSGALFPEGYACIGEKCPAEDHSNPPHPQRIADVMRHKNGGYALIQRWM